MVAELLRLRMRCQQVSVKNEAESFESAAVAAAREQMPTACNVPASAEPLLGSQTTWRHGSCSARRLLAAVLESAKTKEASARQRQQLLRRGFHCTVSRELAHCTMASRSGANATRSIAGSLAKGEGPVRTLYGYGYWQ